MFLRLLLLFTIVPLVELFLLVKLGTVVGVGPTIALVLFTGILGAWLARQQGLEVLRRVNEDLSQGRMPTEALMDGVLILIAGAVLLTPGLLTDALGFVLLIPRTRAEVRKIVAARFARRQKTSQPEVIDVEWKEEE
jgi:UPF0716 protein FxsA